MNVVDRARVTMALLQRAPESPPEPAEDQRMLRADAVELFDKTLTALDFFEPHFQTYDDLITEARKSWWYRLFNCAKVDGMIKLRGLRRSFTHYRDVVASFKTEYEFVTIDPKLTTAAYSWIEWHEQELRRMSKGPYR